MSEQHLEWAVFAPAGVKQLEAVADEVRPPRKGWDDSLREHWRMVDCGGGYAALLNSKPGTLDTYEAQMAKRLSTLLGRPVYVVYPGDDPDFSGVLVYEHGAYTDDLPDDPYEFARGLGCPLPARARGAGSAGAEADVVEYEADEGEAGGTHGKAAVVVEGVSAVEAARALGFDAPPDFEGYDLRIKDGPLGAHVTREEYADLALTAQTLSEGLPGHDVYTVSFGPAPGRLFVWVARDGEGVGFFDTHAGEGAGGGGGAPRLDSVKGQTEPHAIAAALGVSAELPDFEEE